MPTERYPPYAPSDDPTGGRALNRRLLRWVPVGLAVGAGLGAAVAVLTGSVLGGVLVAFLVAALAGTVAAAIEDGRVQRRVDAARGASTAQTLRGARGAVEEGDDERAGRLVERALLRGASVERIVGAVDHPEWDRERVRRIAERLEVEAYR